MENRSYCDTVDLRTLAVAKQLGAGYGYGFDTPVGEARKDKLDNGTACVIL